MLGTRCRSQMTALPQVLLPELFWLSGRADLEIAPTLEPLNVRLQNVVQSDPALEKGANAAWHWRFEKLTPRSSLQLAVTHAAGSSTASVGRVIRLGKTDTKASVYTHFVDSSAGSVRVLSAELADRWLPRTISAEVPYVVNDWYVAESSGRRRLVVRVSQTREDSNAHSAPLKLTLQADRAVSARDEWLPLRECDVLRWDNTTVVDDLLALEVEDGMQVESNPRPLAMAEDTTMPYLGTLLPATLASSVYDRTQLDASIRLYLKPSAPELDIKVLSTVSDDGDRWTIRHRLDCTPVNGAIETLQVITRRNASRDLQWRLGSNAAWQTCRALSKSDGADGRAEWQIDLPSRQSRSFSLQLREADVPGGDWIATPLEFEGARSVRQQVAIRSPRARELEIEASGWDLTSQEPTGQPPLHSCWVPRPGAEARTLTVRHAALGSSMPLATATEAQLRSTLLPEAAARHRIRFQVTNRAEQQLTCRTPAGATDVRWRVGEGHTTSVATDAQAFAIPLQQIDGQQIVELQFVLPNQTLRHGVRLVPPWPEVSIPVDRKQWSIVTPTTYEVSASDAAWPDRSIVARLFGPIAARPTASGVTREPVGFATSELGSMSEHAAAVTFRHLPTVQAQLCLIFVIGLVLGYWLWRQPRYLWPLLAAALVVCLLLPVPHDRWATALWGGLVIAVVLRGVQRVAASFRAWVTSFHDSTALAPTAAVWLAAALVALPATARDAPPPHVESVLIPVDAMGRVVGSNRFVNAQLLAELIRREQLAASADAWLISNPQYVSRLSAAADRRLTTSDPWTLQFDLQVFHANVDVELPIDQTGVRWADEVLLDGLPVAVTWDAETGTARFRPPRPGRYRARWQLTPQVALQGDRAAIGFRVPPLPDGQLQLELPSTVEQLSVDGRRVEPTSDAGRTTTTVSLSLSDRLALDWAQQDVADPVAEVYADQWLLLDVAPERATLEVAVQYLAEVVDPGDPQLYVDGQLLDVDDHSPGNRWYLLESPHAEERGNGERLVRYRLGIDRTEDFGRLRLPRIEAVGAETLHHYLAYEAKPGVRLTLNGTRPMDAEVDFREYWPQRESISPALSIDEQATAVVAVLRPTDEPVIPEESIEVCCFADRLELAYRGLFDQRGQPTAFQLFSVSPELAVTDVRLTVAGESRPVSFRHVEEGSLLVFFAEAVAQPYELTAFGVARMESTPIGGIAATTQVPRMTAVQDGNAPQRLSLYADDQVVASIVDADVVPQLVESPAEPLATWTAYGVTSLLAPAVPTSPIVLRVGRKSPAFRRGHADHLGSPGHDLGLPRLRW